MTPRSFRKHRGVSLIEALVALAVMAFGMLGVAAMQSSLRQNADLARQRAEAVRLAQASIESLRAYSVVNSAAGRVAYADLLAPVAAESIVQTNATYTRTVFIAPNAEQNRKTVDVTVDWSDRTGATHQVRLSSIIHRVPPELSAAPVVPAFGTASQLALGRHPSIPRDAVPSLDGVTSTFTPPQPAGPNPITWIFNNATGLITQRCTGTSCTGLTFNARLLSGYVAFSLGTTQPTPADAEAPTSAPLPVTIGFVNPTPPNPRLPNPLAGTTTECFVETLAASALDPPRRAYFCLIQVLSTDNFVWSARSELTGLAPIAANTSDADAAKYRVCRYTIFRNDNAVGTGTAPAVVTNSDHPYDYLGVDRNLVNQNFLVIRAGDGGTPGTPFDCPDDVVPAAPALNLINSGTWHHQPKS